MAPFYPDNINHQKFSKGTDELCKICKEEVEERKCLDMEEPELYLDKILAEFMNWKNIVSIKQEGKHNIKTKSSQQLDPQ